MVILVLKNSFVQLFFTVGVIAICGLIVWLLNKVFYKLAGNYGKAIGIATGFIGTPVHELGHAFFCLLFGHKVVEIKLYQPNSQDGVLGYVNHTYNKRNIYHQIGNFFIGLGPIILGSGVLMLLMYLLVPDLLGKLNSMASLLTQFNVDSFSFSDSSYILQVLGSTFTVFFSKASFSNPFWWLFMIPACSVALHMSLSIADIKSSSMGMLFIVLTTLIVNTILYYVSKELMWTITKWSLQAGVFTMNFLIIAISFSIILVFIAGILKGSKKLIK